MEYTLLKETAAICEDILQGKIKAVLVEFHGLGGTDFKPGDIEREWGRHGVLVVHPYYGPWTWMNREARSYIDELIAAVYTHFELDGDIPLLFFGGSMGGFSALLYARYAKKKPVACVANCPVCDLNYHYSERPDLPRTILFSFRGYRESLEELFWEHSPLCQAEFLPDIPYLIVHTAEDKAVNKRAHSDRMVAKMREHGLQVRYIELPKGGHCELTEEAQREVIDFVLKKLS